ncbi:NAD-dependent epimerase/dehydratase family protein [Flavihumibacter sp. R14]|nr:NAD-dependent epimerase/dehydratase family protein [Flavihumibacter soli]
MILVTGATGFLGSELVRQLLQQGRTVRAIKRQTSVIPPILLSNDSIEWRDADILDYFALEQAMEGITEVYHCAAMVSFRKEDKKPMLRVNVEGTANLVNICLRNNIRKLVHASSTSAVGVGKNGQHTTETDHWQFNRNQSNYAISKYESEMEVFRGIAEGLNAVIVNPSIIIGRNAGVRGSGQLFQAVKNGLKFYPGGTCGIVDVEDVADIMIRLMNSDIQTERFILNSENISYHDLFGSIARAYGLLPPKYRLKSWMLRSGFLISALARMATGKELGITKEIARSALNVSRYSNEKITIALKTRFKPVNESIQEICRA